MSDFLTCCVVAGAGEALLIAIGPEPMIYNPVNMVACGVVEILIVTSYMHMGEIVAALGSGTELGADFTYKVQEEVGAGGVSPKKRPHPQGVSFALTKRPIDTSRPQCDNYYRSLLVVADPAKASTAEPAWRISGSFFVSISAKL